MTLNTTVVGALGNAYRAGKFASVAVVAGQAPLAEIGNSFLRSGNLMRVMARSTTQSTLALAEAPAVFHLLDVSADFVARPVHAAVDRLERDQGKPGTIVKRLTAQSVDPLITHDVTLLANCPAQ